MTTPSPTFDPGLDFETCMLNTGIPMRLANRFDEDARDNLEAYVASSADSTLAAFRGDIVRWIAWCEVNEGDPLAPRPRAVRQFIREHEHGRKPNTVKRMVANIGVLVDGIAGNGNVTRTKVVKAELKRIRREKGSHQRQALGIRAIGQVTSFDEEAQPFSIERMIEVLEPLDTLASARAAFILSLGGSSGRRSSEYRMANFRHIAEVRDGTGLFTIARSKTDQAGEGMVKFACTRTMRLFRRYRELLSAAGGEIGPDAPLIVAVDRWGHPGARISTAGFNVMIRNAVGAALGILAHEHPEIRSEIGAIVNAVSGHSFRVGLAEDLATAGESIVAICVEGGWETPAMPVRYARGIAARNGAAARLRKRLGETGV